MTPDKSLKRRIARLRGSGHFDAEWYRRTYPDVDALQMDPAYHYLVHGFRMQRDPGPDYPIAFFRALYGFEDGHEPITRLAYLESSPGKTVPEPLHGIVLAAADRCAQQGRPDLAIALAGKHLPPKLAYSIGILHANIASAAGDEAAWLGHLNRYLGHFGVSPVSLSGEGPLLRRLRGAAPRQVTDGPLISVLMAAWNSEKTLRAAAESILGQSWRNLELLIVDDASSDGTWPILQALAAADPRVRIFRNEVNAGPYVSKNVALTQARGDWITGHDADDWAHPERLERQWRFSTEKGNFGCLSGMLRMAGDGRFVRLNPVNSLVHDGACRSAFISLMLRTQYFRDLLGSWDGVRVAGDAEVLRRIERVEGREVPQLPVVTMLCSDSPEGLTNHATLGHSESRGMSRPRILYRASYREFHAGLSRRTGRIPPFPAQRPFPAPEAIINPPGTEARLLAGYRAQGVALKQDLAADVAVVTNLRFPGGSASSTLDELEHFAGMGRSLVLVHCPTDPNLGRETSERYAPWRHIIVNWTEVGSLSAKVLIVRNPSVIGASAFAELAPKLRAERGFFVMNNARKRVDGTPAYDLDAALAAMDAVEVPRGIVCPIGPAIRAELEDLGDGGDGRATRLEISDRDWTPTFEPALYRRRPKAQMQAPFVIGRHARDGAEKWHEDPEMLRRIYPADPDFRILILGGARVAETSLGGFPANWTVHPFGSVPPHEYLRELDAFVYFPHSDLVEAFGRTAVEAMLAGVPVLLPRRFEATFGELALYCEPEAVEAVIRRLARSHRAARVAYLAEVQAIAAARYGREAIAARVGLSAALGGVQAATELSPASRAFRAGIGGTGAAAQDLAADIAVVTNLRFPGGSASSTLDELEHFAATGRSLVLVHCPADSSLGRETSERYAPWRHITVNWTEVGSLTAKVLIVRNPAVAGGAAFAELAPKLRAERGFFVVNNGRWRADGGPAYDPDAAFAAMGAARLSRAVVCPVGPEIRAEIEDLRQGGAMPLELLARDWTPTFDPALYRQPPKAAMQAPFAIGRHARDGADKWHEDPEMLRQIYPAGPDFRILILGGAQMAEKALGELPANWTVHPFGSVPPHEYLQELDAFVFFPHTGRIEAFARAPVEAMLAGVPVLLPPSFEATYGDLAFYCASEAVEAVIRRLAASDPAARVACLAEVQAIAAARFGRAAIEIRVGFAAPPDTQGTTALSPAARAFRAGIIEAGQAAARPPQLQVVP